MTESASNSSVAFSLTEPVLYWASFDTSSLVTVTISQFLKSQTAFLNQRLSADQLTGTSNLGLIVWAIHEPSQAATTIHAILQSRKQNSPALLIVFLAPELLQFRSALIESGSHLVVHELSQIPKVLSSCLDNLPLSREGVHPITSGLVGRLPWAHLDKKEN